VSDVPRDHTSAALRLAAVALAKSEERGEHWYDGELHRLRGELLWKIGRPEDAELEFGRALTVGRNQQARLWELRATTSLARLRCDQSRKAEARALLEPVYSWFTEASTPLT
jgi:predicted ATPase